jgi:lysozyme family protein
MYSLEFEKAFRKTLDLEGGDKYTNIEGDNGGETKYGISKKAFPNEDIKNLTLERAKYLHYTYYWEPLKLDGVDSHIAEEMYDTAFNMGVGTAIKILQDSINFLSPSNTLEVDGKMGPKTLESFKYWINKDEEALFRCLNGFQFMRFVQIVLHNNTQKKFSRGWMKRIQDFS